MFIKYFTIVCLFTFSLACLSQGQSEKVKVQFVTFPMLSNAEPFELLIGNGETIEVELPTNSLSPEYEVDRLTEWALGRSSTGGDGEFIFNTYGRAPLLTSPNQLILVLQEGPNPTDGFELIPMNNDQSGFGGGKYFFLNAAKVDIAVEIGDLKFALSPMKHRLVEPEPSKQEGRRKYLYVYLHFRRGNDAIPFYSSTWRFSERARSMVFFYHDTHTKQLRTHTVRNFISSGE